MCVGNFFIHCFGTLTFATYLYSSSVDRLPDLAFALNEDDEDVDRQCEVFKHVCAKNVHSLEDAEENAWEDTNLGSFQTSENESRYKTPIFSVVWDGWSLVLFGMCLKQEQNQSTAL